MATDQEKTRIVSNFIAHSPPGEFNEVFNDCRVLLENDNLLRDDISGSFEKYNKDQFTPCQLEGGDSRALVTEHGDLGGGRFFDPRTQQSFKYDHLRKVSSEVRPAQADETAEPWRKAVEKSVTAYIEEHFEHGTCSVYGTSDNSNITLIVCVESHRYNPQNFWNGRWRSQWSVTFSSGADNVELTGIVKVQVHYYEDGNVQLVSSKEVKEPVSAKSKEQLSSDIKRVVADAEQTYQNAISENYRTMSETTFKALRRNLPITRSKIDWNKIMGYKIGGLNK